MHGVRLSRWSQSYFTAAVISLLLAEMIWASGVADPLNNVSGPWVLVGVHLTTIGFLSLLMLGALHQFVPVLTETELANQPASGLTLGCVVVGLSGMILGFLALGQKTPGVILWALPIGGTLVVIGVIVALLNLGVTLKRAWPWTLSAWLVATGLAYLLLTVLAGLTFALSFADPRLFPPSWHAVLSGRGLAAHVMGGVGGWLTLTAMGVSYKLLAMFTLSDEHRRVAGWLAYGFTAVGIFVVWLSRWIQANRWSEGAWLLVLVGLALYLWDMRDLYRRRRRRQLELNSRYAIIAFLFLATLLLVGLLVRPTAMQPMDLGLTFWALYGWLGGLALTQLYKIVPFLTWLDRYGKRMGTGKIPRVQDLVDEDRDRYAYLVYFVAVALGSLFLYAHWSTGFRVALATSWLATLDIVRALYHASHPKATGEDT